MVDVFDFRQAIFFSSQIVCLLTQTLLGNPLSHNMKYRDVVSQAADRTCSPSRMRLEDMRGAR